MQLRNAIEGFMLECKVRRLASKTLANDGKHLRCMKKGGGEGSTQSMFWETMKYSLIKDLACYKIIVK